jgi:uncharacterized membrane protein
MTWLNRYRVRNYFLNSIWISPVLGMLAALGAVRLLHRIEEGGGWESSLDPDTARALLGTVASALFTFVVFVSSALLVAVQLASAQLTPRIIALIYKDPVNRFALTFFVFTFTFSLAALVRIKSSVPLLTAHSAAYGCAASLAVFLYMIDHVGKALRPSGALGAVAREGRKVIDSVYPRSLSDSKEGTAREAARVPDAGPAATILSPGDGVVLAFDPKGLLALARRADCVIEMVPQVGDHVAAGDPLFRVYPGAAAPPPGVLCRSVALGQERTLEQDPTIAFRIMVDIANKALSPAINDPTTAVLALDQIHHLLHRVGLRRLDTGEVHDAAGRLRLVYRTPDWEDFVRLAVTEIRHFGGESIQVARRMRAMLESLIRTLPEERAALLRQELALLHRSAERSFPEPEDRALAEVSDSLGVGGTQERDQGSGKR